MELQPLVVMIRMQDLFCLIRRIGFFGYADEFLHAVGQISAGFVEDADVARAQICGKAVEVQGTFKSHVLNDPVADKGQAYAVACQAVGGKLLINLHADLGGKAIILADPLRSLPGVVAAAQEKKAFIPEAIQRNYFKVTIAVALGDRVAQGHAVGK